MTLYRSDRITFVRHSAHPVNGMVQQTYVNQGITRQFGWMGAAATANIHFIPPTERFEDLIDAYWMLAWTPNANGQGQTGLQLVHFHSTEADLVEGPQVMSSYPSGATTEGSYTNVTEFLRGAMQRARQSGLWINMGMRAHGNGVHGALVYLSEIVCRWRTPDSE